MCKLLVLKNAWSESHTVKKSLGFNYTVLPPSIDTQICMCLWISKCISLRLLLKFIFLLSLVMIFKNINVFEKKDVLYIKTSNTEVKILLLIQTYGSRSSNFFFCLIDIIIL